MEENREKYKEKITVELINKLKLDMTRVYEIAEIDNILDTNNLRGGILQFVPTKAHTGEMIIATLVEMAMRISDAIDKEFGLYEDKTRCEQCNNYFDEDTERMFQITHEKGIPVLCEKCRRKNKFKIAYHDFRKRIPDEDKEEFMKEELEYGIDYSDYVERLNKHKAKLKKMGVNVD